MAKLSRFRDLQVQQYLLAHLPWPKDAGADLKNELAFLEFRSAPDLMDHLKAFSERRLAKKIRNVMTLLVNMPQDQAALKRVEERMISFFSQAHAELISLRSMIRPESPETIHRLRVAFKKYRYLMEALEPLRVHPDEAAMAEMHELQGLMGDIQDIHVLLNYIADWGKRNEDQATNDQMFSHLKEMLSEKIGSLLPKLNQLENFRLILNKY